MARGEYNVKTQAVGGEIEILNRKEFEATPMTIDFTSVAEGVVKAGSPVNAVGVPTETAAVGLVLHDVYAEYPNVAVLKEGYVNVERWKASTGKSEAATALKTALLNAGCRIVFE